MWRERSLRDQRDRDDFFCFSSRPSRGSWKLPRVSIRESSMCPESRLQTPVSCCTHIHFIASMLHIQLGRGTIESRIILLQHVSRFRTFVFVYARNLRVSFVGLLISPTEKVTNALSQRTSWGANTENTVSTKLALASLLGRLAEPCGWLYVLWNFAHFADAY